MAGRGWIAMGAFLTILGLVVIVWGAIGNSVPILTGQSLSLVGVFAVVLGYILTVGGFAAYARQEKETIKDRDTYIRGVRETIRGEHPPPAG